MILRHMFSVCQLNLRGSLIQNFINTSDVEQLDFQYIFTYLHTRDVIKLFEIKPPRTVKEVVFYLTACPSFYIPHIFSTTNMTEDEHVRYAALRFVNQDNCLALLDFMIPLTENELLLLLTRIDDDFVAHHIMTKCESASFDAYVLSGNTDIRHINISDENIREIAQRDPMHVNLISSSLRNDHEVRHLFLSHGNTFRVASVIEDITLDEIDFMITFSGQYLIDTYRNFGQNYMNSNLRRMLIEAVDPVSVSLLSWILIDPTLEETTTIIERCSNVVDGYVKCRFRTDKQIRKRILERASPNEICSVYMFFPDRDMEELVQVFEKATRNQELYNCCWDRSLRHSITGSFASNSMRSDDESVDEIVSRIETEDPTLIYVYCKYKSDKKVKRAVIQNSSQNVMVYLMSILIDISEDEFIQILGKCHPRDVRVVFMACEYQMDPLVRKYALMKTNDTFELWFSLINASVEETLFAFGKSFSCSIYAYCAHKSNYDFRMKMLKACPQDKLDELYQMYSSPSEREALYFIERNSSLKNGYLRCRLDDNRKVREYFIPNAAIEEEFVLLMIPNRLLEEELFMLSVCPPDAVERLYYACIHMMHPALCKIALKRSPRKMSILVNMIEPRSDYMTLIGK